MSQHTTSFCCLVKKMSVDKNVNSLFIKIETIKKMRKKYIRSLDNYSIDNYSNAYCKKPYFIRKKIMWKENYFVHFISTTLQIPPFIKVILFKLYSLSYFIQFE